VGPVTLGVSIAVPEPYGTLLQESRAGFGDTAAHSIPTHITLLPPTEVEATALPEIEAHLARVAAETPPFRVRLSGTATFRPLSPVVYVQVVEGASACSLLQERVRADGGPLVRELAFPYHPHVTVAHGISEEAMDRAQAELRDFEAAWPVTGFALHELGRDQVWRLRRQFAFAAGDEPPGEADADGASADAPGLSAVPRQAAPSPACDGGSAPSSFAPLA
jgi:2'-5' RNA ligase